MNRPRVVTLQPSPQNKRSNPASQARRTRPEYASLPLIALLLLASMANLALAAGREAATEQVRAQLVASADAVHPGDEILLGVQQRIIPHWHTYWINPGDSGLATRIRYQLPAGVQAGEIQWPTPSRITLGSIVNYGYENEVTLLTSVRIPPDSRTGSNFPVKAKVNWLVCEESCIPQQVELELTLPVVDAATSGGNGSPLIAEAQARLPAASPWPLSLSQSGPELALKLAGYRPATAEQTLWFYPEQWGRVAHGAAQSHERQGEDMQIRLTAGEQPLKPGDSLDGVLAITEQTADGAVTKAYRIHAPLPAVLPQAAAEQGGLILPSALLLAFLGGAVLNLMPCVFPVLSLKALSLAGQAGLSANNARLHGWLYALGIQTSFALLAGALLLFKAGGGQIGWGFQFQSPLFVLAIAYLLFAVGLSLSGVFSLGGSLIGAGSALAERRGYSGSFFSGVLAALVATPCTAPFMGAAIAYALSQPPAVLLAVFQALGFGLALPYLALSHWPLLQRHLPRPGAWMETLKQLLAFPMYAAAAWLVWVLAQQGGADAVAVALAGLLAIGFAAWLFERGKYAATGLNRAAGVFSLVLLSAALGGGYAGLNSAARPGAEQGWEPYSAARLQELRGQEQAVFVNFTAAWCISCLLNEQVALSTDQVKQAFQAAGIRYLKGDWTNRDPEIGSALAEYGRSGVPLYLYYPPGKSAQPHILPQILTPEIVTDAIASDSAPELGL